MDGHERMEKAEIIRIDERPLTRERAERLSAGALVETSRKSGGFKMTEEGRIKSVLDNYEAIISHDPYFSGKIRFNLMNNKVMLKGFYWQAEEHPIEDIDLHYIRNHISRVYDISAEDSTKAAVEMVAHQHSYHPVRDILNSLEWDGVPRLDRLFVRYLGAPDTELTHAITRMTFYGAIQRIFHPGIKYDACTILAGGQGSGKSTEVSFLALKEEWFTDSVPNMNDPKVSGEVLQGKWIVELAEMVATRKTKEIDDIKSFITRKVDNYRDPYATYARDHLRQCIFIGTTNRASFLPDDSTGNRRFFPIICDASKAEVHPLDDEAESRDYVLQCYAEAMVRGKADGFPLVLDKKHLDELNAIRSDAEPEDGKVTMIQEYLDTCGEDYTCNLKIFYELFHPDEFPGDAGVNGKPVTPTKYELADIREIMQNKITGWARYKGNKKGSRKFGKYGEQRAWVRTDKSRMKPRYSDSIIRRVSDAIFNEDEAALQKCRVDIADKMRGYSKDYIATTGYAEAAQMLTEYDAQKVDAGVDSKVDATVDNGGNNTDGFVGIGVPFGEIR